MARQHERAYLVLLNMAEQENECRCELIIHRHTKLSCSRFLVLYTPPFRPTTLECCRGGLSPLQTDKWDNLYLTCSIRSQVSAREWSMCQIPSSRLGETLPTSVQLRCHQLSPLFTWTTHILQLPFKGSYLRLQQLQQPNSLRMGWRPRSEKGCYRAGSPVR